MPHYDISTMFPLFHYLFVTSLLCSGLRLSVPLFVMSLYYISKVSIVSLSACYVTALFEVSTVSSSVCCATVLSHCFSIWLLCHCYVLGFDCLVFCLLRHHAVSSRFLLVHYRFVTSLLYSGLRLSLLPFCYDSVIF